MKKFKKGAYSLAAVAALALTIQAPAEAGGHERGAEFALRQAMNLQRGNRQNRDRFFMQNGEVTGSRRENRILRMQNRLGVDTASSINAAQNQRAAAHLIRLNSIDLNGLPSDLNLRSRRDNYVLSNLNGTVTISRGGEDVVVNSNTKLTAAEIAAVYQVLNDGGQSLALGRRGDAEGGSLTLDAASVNGLSSLSIPKNVTITGDFTSASQLGIGGDLRNAGNLLVRSNDPSVAAATISAANIRNTRSGSIGTVDAGSKALDLNLFASMDIVNQGSISGGGNINLAAGGSIFNVREPGSSPTDPAPSITAGNNLSMQSSSILNNGIITATAGNINIADQLQAGNNFITVNAQGGTFNATKGDITIGSNSFVQSDRIVLSGGNYYSNNLNLNAGEGSIDGIIGDVIGLVKTSAGVAHIGASTEVLNLGQSVITGDPTFFNDLGGIRVSGNLLYGEAISILASGTIDDDSKTNYLILSQDGSGLGHDITIIAGAKLTDAGGAESDSFAEPGRQITQGTVKVSGASKTGGDVNLSKSTVSSQGFSGQSGGDIVVVALASKKSGGGHVNIGDVQAAGDLGGDNGNVLIYAGSNSGAAITAPNINTGNGSGTTGNILLSNSQAKVKMTFDVTGTGVGTITGGKLAGGGIDARAITNHGGNIEIESAGFVSLGFTGTKVSANGLAGKNAGSIIVTGSEVNLNDAVEAIGGDGANGGPASTAGQSGGAGGDITLTSTNGRIFLYPTGSILSQGGKGGDGTSSALAGSAGSAGGAGGKSGNITLKSIFDVNINGGGVITKGGDGGQGSNGVNGDFTSTNGGAGGAAGIGGSSGSISLQSGGGMIISSTLSSAGGAGGNGGRGGDADVVTSGGEGGVGAAGASGGGSGNITLLNTSGSMDINAPITTDSGFNGSGGNGGAGGIGSGSPGTNGGAGGAGGNGSKSGNITITSTASDINVGSGVVISSSARNGGGGGAGGSGTDGGNGSNGAVGGLGGDAGSVSLIITSKFGEINGDGSTLISVAAGAGGRGGDGGAGGGQGNGTGGNGGDGGTSLGSGKNGSINLSGPEIDFTGSLIATHFSGKAAGGSGGAGGAMTGDLSGNGGKGGAGASGAVGGTITITGGNVNLGILSVDGTQGASGGSGGFAGTGGGSIADGNAGSGGNGGSGAQGGSISISGISVVAQEIYARGASGGNGGDGRDAGTNTMTSLNGDGGASGAQGGGGNVKLFTKGKTSPDIQVVTINVNAGGVSFSGDGGTTLGRIGGTAGAVGVSASGGNIDIQSARNIVLSNVSATGGLGGVAGVPGPGAGGTAGAKGGDGGTIYLATKKGNLSTSIGTTIDFSGGAGSNGGNAGVEFTGPSAIGSDGGSGGTFTIVTKGTATLAGDVNGLGGSGGTGGLTGNDFASPGGAGGVGGIGGSVAITSTAADFTNLSVNGGAGGTGSTGGAGVIEQNGEVGGVGGVGGAGGKVTLVKMKGDINFGSLTADGGTGGTGGMGGLGGASGIFASGKTGGDGGKGGFGGLGGQIQLLTRGTVTSGSVIAARGGDGGTGGMGGAAGIGTVVPGTGGAGGDGGNGAQGGSIAGSSVVPTADVDGGAAGTGGLGGVGVPAGSPGTDGQPGQDGTITP